MTADCFAVFDLPRAFDLDLSDLEKLYFAAQRRFHPDRFVGKGALERREAIGLSMRINEAYETLKSPLTRARHLLALAGVSPDSLKPSQALLTEIMEMREALAEADSAASLQAIAERNRMEIASLFAELSAAFAIPDFAIAAELAMRLNYLAKMEEEIRLRGKNL